MGKTTVILEIIVFNIFLIAFFAGIFVFIRQYRIKKKQHNTMLQNQIEMHQKELLSTQIEIQYCQDFYDYSRDYFGVLFIKQKAISCRL